MLTPANDQHTNLTPEPEDTAAATKDPYAQYKSQSLSTMAPGELLVKLFEELIKQSRLAVMAIEKKDYAAANDSLVKGQTIVNTLAGALDMRYPISKELREMYIFLSQTLLKANLSKDTKLIKDVLPIMKDFRDSFEKAEKINRRNQHQVGGKAVV